MQVKDRLSCARADVEDGSVSLFDISLARNLGGCKMALSDQLGVVLIRFLEPGEMSFGNDQHMRGSLRLYVLKGEDVFILINFAGGNLAGNNPAEEARARGGSHYGLTCRLAVLVQPSGNDNTCTEGLSAAVPLERATGGEAWW
jgi:hypothetical protein